MRFVPVAERVTDKTTGEVTIIYRLCGTGIFNNPNDISRILIVGMVICLYKLNAPRSWRLIWGRPVSFLLCVDLDILARSLHCAARRSRGRVLESIRGRTWIPLLLSLPLVFVIFGGRQTDLSTREGTGQQRIRLWSRGMLLFRNAPVFGIGVDQYAKECGGYGAS